MAPDSLTNKSKRREVRRSRRSETLIKHGVQRVGLFRDRHHFTDFGRESAHFARAFARATFLPTHSLRPNR